MIKMKKVLIILIFSIIFISCKDNIEEKNKNTQNIEKMNDLKNAPYNLSELSDGVKYDYDTLSINYINKIKSSLINRNFKFLDKQNFQERILEVFNFNIDDYKNNIIVLRPAMFTEIVIKDQKFILVEDAETDNSENINSDLEYNFNSYILNNDKNSFNWLKFNQKELLETLVVEYGFNQDKELLKFIFKDFDFDNKTLFHNLIFSKDIKTGEFRLREALLKDIENIVYGGGVVGYTEAKEGNGYNSLSEIVEIIRKNSKQYFEPEKNIASLYERDLSIGIVGHVESNLTTDTKYKTFLKNNNYFGNSRLKDYAEDVFGDDVNTNDSIIIYKIQDPDGYTNLRKDKNTTSSILEKIKTGEIVEVVQQSGDWYLVKTKSGNQGYVFKTKIVYEQ